MLEALFTSHTRIKILSLLMFHPDKEYHLREIARIIQASPRYVSKELEKLLRINLVHTYAKGNLTIYAINRNNSILPELRAIFLKTDFIGTLIKNKLKGKATYAFLYGSFAQGEETEQSDIDLFVIGTIKEDELIRIIQNIEKKVSREVNYVLWSEHLFRQRAQSHHLLQTIKKSKIIMLVGEEHEFRKAIR